MPSPQAAGAQFFSLGDDDVEAPAAVRPAPLVEVRPQMGYKRHCGSGFELVLDVTVPQLGRELVEVPNVVSPVVEQNVHIQPPAPVEEYISHTPAVFPATAPVIDYISPAPAVFPATPPVVEYFSPVPAVFPATAPAGGVFLTRASASGGVFLTRASRVSSDSASGGVFLTRASRASCEFISGCWWRFSRLFHRTEFNSSRWSCCPWSRSSGPCATSGGRALRAGRAPS